LKIAVLSDIHGNLPALKAVLDEVEGEGVDAVVNLGDSLSGPLMPAETADLLRDAGFVTIAGNQDRGLLAQWQRPEGERALDTSDGYAATQVTEAHARWLQSLPSTHWLTPDVLLVHCTPAVDRKYLLETLTPDFGLHGSAGVRAASPEEIASRLASGEEDCRRASLVLCGHSHLPRAALVGGTLVLNPGSVGLQAYLGEEPVPHCVQNGAPHARYAIVEKRGAHWNARLCSVAYDWDGMQQLAANCGRDDWAYALATGNLPPGRSTIGG